MAGRTRTTKKLAQRIDLDYFKTLTGIPRWRRILSGILVAAGLVWLGWHGVRGSPRPYDAGPVAHAHALFAAKCGACHVSGGFQRTATDQACLACHDGPIHHAEQTFAPACADCHVEHKGALRLASTTDQACTQCHADLASKGKNAPPKFAAKINGFDGSHPEFAPLRPGIRDPGTVKFNHQVHLDAKKGIRGPHGVVVLKCADCHRLPQGIRDYMAPVNYVDHCASCHALQFDKRIGDPAPHKEPKIVYDFVRQRLTAYIAANPGAIHMVDEPDKRLPSRPVPPMPRNAQEWVAYKLADAQLLLWRKACKECHSLSYPAGGGLPVVAKAEITKRWLTHASFDHESHQMLACASCHAKAASSRETSDVLLPGIRVCQECHRAGENSAEARCFECHTYHDWSKEKRVNGTFTVRQLTE